MIDLEIRDLSTWILVEAYRNGTAHCEPQADGEKVGPGWLGTFKISRRAIYRDYFGRDRSPWSVLPGAVPAAEAPRLVGLKKAAVLAASVKLLLKQKLIAPPDFLAARISLILSVQSEYLYLTKHGANEAESLLADLS